MGEASRVAWAIAKESTYGVNPGTGFRYLRRGSDRLKPAAGFFTSSELDFDGQPPTGRRITRSAEGSITCEDSLIDPAASPGNDYDLLHEGVLRSAWTTIIALTAQEIDIENVGGGTFDLEDQHVSADAFTLAVVGQVLKLTGFDTNGTIYARILSKASNALVTCEGVRATGAAVTAEAGQTDIAIKGSMLRIGTTRNSYTIERQHLDLTTPAYQLATGCLPGRWTWGITADGAVEQTFEFLGQLHAISTSSAAGSPAAKWATPVLVAPFDFKNKMEGSFAALATHRIVAVSFNFDGQVRRDAEVGSDTPQIAIAQPLVTGELQVFMDNHTLAAKMDAETLSKLSWRMTDASGRDRLFTFPQIRLQDWDAPAEGNNRPVVQRIPFNVEKDANGVAMQIDRMPA